MILLGPAAAHAGGFFVPEIGPRAAAMAAAVTAQAEDASAIVQNPAGIAGQEGTQIQMSTGVFVPSIEFFRRPVVDPNSATGEQIRFAPTSADSTPSAIPFLGVISDLGRKDLAVGLSLSVPFGAALSFDPAGSQRHVVTKIALKAIHLTGGAGYRVSDRLRVGVAVNGIFADMELRQRNALQFVTGDPEVFPDPDPGAEGNTVITGRDAFSVSGSLGVLYSHPGGKFNVGASLLTPVTLRFKGDAAVTNASIAPLMNDAGDEVQPAGERRDKVSMEIPLPLIVRLGAAVKVHPRVLVAFDVNWQRWSTFKELTIDFQNEYELLPTPGAYLYDVTVENKWKDTFSVRLGTEVTPSATSPLRLRGGILFDQSPVDDQHYDLLTPDSDKIGVSAGLGYAFALSGGRTVDVAVAYQRLFLAERDVDDSVKTILNKPAPSFYSGITRAHFDAFNMSAGVRF